MMSLLRPPPTRGFETVLARLSEESERWFGGRALIHPVRRMDRPFSTILHVRVRTGGAEMYAFIKQLKAPDVPDADLPRLQRRVQREFAATEGARQTLPAGADFSIVRPIVCFPDELVLVTEQAAGETLDRILTGRGSAPSEAHVEALRRAGSRIGAWVRSFQGSALPGERVSLDAARSYLDTRLDRLVSSRRGGLTAEDRRRALRLFDAQAARVPSSDLAATAIHADLCPENVLVEPARVTVLDFSMVKTGAIFHDLAHLHMHLGLLRARGRASGAAIDAFEGAMLGSYDPDLAPGRPLFALMLLQHVVCHLAGLAERKPWRLERLYGWRLRRHRERCLRLLRLVSPAG